MAKSHHALGVPVNQSTAETNLLLDNTDLVHTFPSRQNAKTGVGPQKDHHHSSNNSMCTTRASHPPLACSVQKRPRLKHARRALACWVVCERSAEVAYDSDLAVSCLLLLQQRSS